MHLLVLNLRLLIGTYLQGESVLCRKSQRNVGEQNCHTMPTPHLLQNAQAALSSEQLSCVSDVYAFSLTSKWDPHVDPKHIILFPIFAGLLWIAAPLEAQQKEEEKEKEEEKQKIIKKGQKRGESRDVQNYVLLHAHLNMFFFFSHTFVEHVQNSTYPHGYLFTTMD